MKTFSAFCLLLLLAGCASFASFDPPPSFGARDSFMRVSP